MVVIVSLFIALLFFLFSFYYYARDDFYFIRKGLTMEYLFNVLLLGLFWSVFVARLVYILINLKIAYLSPIKFVLIPYFPGISIFGGIVGLFLSYAFLTKRRKIPRKRFADYTAIALLSSFPILFLGVYLNLYLFIMYLVLFIFFVTVLFPKYTNGLLREGTISYIFLIMVSLVSFLQDIFLLYTKNMLLQKESFLFFGLFFVSFFLLIRLETKKTTKSP